MNSKKQTILVSGITGFLGRNLLKYICKNYPNKYKIIGFGVTPEKVLRLKNKIKLYNEEIEIKCINIFNDNFELEEIFVNNKIDYVIHSAAIKFMDFTNTIKLLETNVIGTMNLVKLSKKYSVKNLIAISTDKANSAINSYGMSKNFMEKIVSHYNFSVYQGVNFLWSDGSVLDIWSNQIKKNEKLNITNFEQSRHYCHVTTVCKDLIENLDNKNNTLIPSNVFELKLIDLFLNFIKFFDYDKNKTNIFGDRKDEKLSEELLQYESYTIESNFDIYKKLKFTYENEDINM